jgi:hypothetical protein
MSSISEHYSLPARRKARRQRTRDARSRAGDGAIPIMGPANRASGISIMGAPGPTVDVMGAAGTGPRVSLMGPSDRGPRQDVFGESEPGFVDSLFTGVRGDR